MKKGHIEIQVLKEVDPSIKLTIEKPVDPKGFFVDREGLYVYSGFEERVLEKSEAVKVGAEYAIESLDLVDDSTDKQIELALGNKNLFEVNDACAIVADLIERQKNGEDGLLLTNGYANLFYTSACVVYVRWRGSGWRVGTWERDGIGWVAGLRVFSPQLALEL